MPYTIQHVQKILNARWLQKVNPDANVEQLLLDSRNITTAQTALFFALSGQRHDGHRFLADCYRAGIRNFIVSRELSPGSMPEANVLIVPDALLALQTLAAWHRAQFRLPVVGITGSNGKTMVKEWLHQLLPREKMVRSPKSYNSQIGVPLSVWQTGPEHQLGIFEAGISQMGEMERLAGIIRPDIGLITNLGPAHREGFPSDTVKLQEKMRLFEPAKMLVFCADHLDIAEAANVWAAARKGRSLLRWSSAGRDAEVQFSGFKTLPDGHVKFQISTGSAPGQQAVLVKKPQIQQLKSILEIPFSDAASIENACHCITVLLALGYPLSAFSGRLKRLEPVEMRLELKAGINNCTIINDAYSNDLASLRIALQFARQQSRDGQITLILSDFLQTGRRKDPLYKQVAASLLEHRVQRLIAIGPDTGVSLRTKLPADFNASFYPDTDAFLQNLQAHDFNEDLILVKGARMFAFERIAQRLEQKAHKTVLEVNLGAVVHNLNVYNRLLKPGTKMMVMVKAAGYGSGAAELAKLLEFHQVDYLGVAYADEGIELRQAGVKLPILVLNPEPSGFDALARFRLEPEVYSLSLLNELLRFAGKTKEMAVHLKLDTGMHRLGFVPADLDILVSRLQAQPKVQVRSVFSHLAAADAPQHDTFTHQQAAMFTAMFGRLSAGLGYRPLRHLVNTGGMVRFPEYQFDMVRLGIGLYGIDSCGLQDQLQVVNTLKATISQIKELPAGETVGYNRNGPITRPSRIATISIGYADGLLRLAGNGRYKVLVHGSLAPTVGNICMDMTMVDVTHIPKASEGDEVIVFGESLPVQALADCLQTIPYEVFTNIADRVKRVYWQ